MSTSKYFPRTFHLLKKISLKTKKDTDNSRNELIHPRFGITKNNSSLEKKASNSLLFLMYSEENEALFI